MDSKKLDYDYRTITQQYTGKDGGARTVAEYYYDLIDNGAGMFINCVVSGVDYYQGYIAKSASRAGGVITSSTGERFVFQCITDGTASVQRIATETVETYIPTLNTTNVQSAELRLNISGKVAKLIITNLVLKNAVSSDTAIATLPNSFMSGGQGVARGFGISLSGKLHEFHINPSANVVYIAGLNSPSKENIYGELTFMLQ